MSFDQIPGHLLFFDALRDDFPQFNRILEQVEKGLPGNDQKLGVLYRMSLGRSPQPGPETHPPKDVILSQYLEHLAVAKRVGQMDLSLVNDYTLVAGSSAR
jgi:hypothetical protein